MRPILRRVSDHGGYRETYTPQLDPGVCLVAACPLTRQPVIGSRGLELPKFRFATKHASDWISEVEKSASPTFTDNLLSSETITDSQLDQAIGSLHDAMVEASAKTMRAPKYTPSASPWFTKEVQSALDAVRTAYQKVRGAHTSSPPIPPSCRIPIPHISTETQENRHQGQKRLGITLCRQHQNLGNLVTQLVVQRS